MVIHPNFYSLVFIALENDSKALEKLTELSFADHDYDGELGEPAMLKDCLRLHENLIGVYQNMLVISTYEIHDFFEKELGSFVVEIVGHFPNSEILATYYYSVPEEKGICWIKNKSVIYQYLTSDKDTANTEIIEKIEVMEENFLKEKISLSLSEIIGQDIHMKTLELYN